MTCAIAPKKLVNGRALPRKNLSDTAQLAAADLGTVRR